MRRLLRPLRLWIARASALYPCQFHRGSARYCHFAPHFNLFKHAVHGFAAANNLANSLSTLLSCSVRARFSSTSRLSDDGFPDRRGRYRQRLPHVGNLAQQIQIGSGKHFLFALPSFSTPSMVSPDISGNRHKVESGCPRCRTTCVHRGLNRPAVEIDQQHLFTFEHAFGEGSASSTSLCSWAGCCLSR